MTYGITYSRSVQRFTEGQSLIYFFGASLQRPAGYLNKNEAVIRHQSQHAYALSQAKGFWLSSSSALSLDTASSCADLHPAHDDSLRPSPMISGALVLSVIAASLYSLYSEVQGATLNLRTLNRTPGSSCDVSMLQSSGFFCEGKDSWSQRQNVYKNQQLKQVTRKFDKVNVNGFRHAPFWQSNYEPNFSCAKEERLGRSGDGGKVRKRDRAVEA